MDEEHSRESLPEDGMDAENTREKEHGTEENSVTKSITETDKPVVREAWNTVYSREKRLEELRRKRMEAASQKTNKAKEEPQKDIQDDHSESDTEIEENENKTVSDPVTDTNEVT